MLVSVLCCFSKFVELGPMDWHRFSILSSAWSAGEGYISTGTIGSAL